MSATTDRVAVRIGGFVVVLAVLFGAAFGLGRLVDGDVDDEPTAPSYRLELAADEVRDSRRAEVSFTIRDAAGRAVTRFAERHERRLHLIAVRDDFSGFQHVHPTMAADGTWTATLATYSGGYRLFADFQEQGGAQSVAHADLLSRGNDDSGFTAVAPQLSRTAQVGPYDVVLAGDLAAGSASTLTFAVSRDGEPVTELEPYLGAYGHLVVLRGSDKRYLHAHPEDGPAGPGVAFGVEVPTADRYYLYLDFKHGGKVRTATFALAASATATGSEKEDHDGGH